MLTCFELLEATDSYIQFLVLCCLVSVVDLQPAKHGGLHKKQGLGPAGDALTASARQEQLDAAVEASGVGREVESIFASEIGYSRVAGGGGINV